MDRIQAHENERKVMRWGGLAGVAGGLLFILVFILVGALVPADAAQTSTAVRWFPDVRLVRVVENGLYLGVLILWTASFLAVYRAARVSLAPALFGSALGIAGLCVLAVGALPHVAIAPLSDLYHAPGATPDEQAMLSLVWQASQGMLDASLLAGLALLSVGLVVLGIALVAVPAYGRRIGVLTVALGALGGASTVVVMADPRSPATVLGMLALIVFHLVVGWRTFALARRDRGLEAVVAGAGPAGAPRAAIEGAG